MCRVLVQSPEWHKNNSKARDIFGKVPPHLGGFAQPNQPSSLLHRTQLVHLYRTVGGLPEHFGQHFLISSSQEPKIKSNGGMIVSTPLQDPAPHPKQEAVWTSQPQPSPPPPPQIYPTSVHHCIGSASGGSASGGSGPFCPMPMDVTTRGFPASSLPSLQQATG